jgi:hypothetical protein
VVWILRLVKIGAEAEGHDMKVMEINRPDDVGSIADLTAILVENPCLIKDRRSRMTPNSAEVTHCRRLYAEAHLNLERMLFCTRRLIFLQCDAGEPGHPGYLHVQ